MLHSVVGFILSVWSNNINTKKLTLKVSRHIDHQEVKLQSVRTENNRIGHLRNINRTVIFRLQIVGNV